jgi:Domain of Unknown Function (DUF1080)
MKHFAALCSFFILLSSHLFSQQPSPEFEIALKQLPEAEESVRLFNGKDLAGWDGKEGIWSVEDGCIKGANTEPVAASTYLFTKDSFRNFRLLFEVKQTMSPQHSTMHSAVCVLGEKIKDQGGEHGFRGPLLMFCHDWGIWDANRRNRVVPSDYKTTWQNPNERKGEWNLIEVLVIGDRIRFAANGKEVFDFTDKTEMLRESSIGLQVHSNDKPQEWRFRGLVLTKKPEDRLITVQK